MVVLVQLAERQIVALEVKGSTPLDHPIFITTTIALLEIWQIICQDS